MTSACTELDDAIWTKAGTLSAAEVAAELQLSKSAVCTRLLQMACERVNSGECALPEAALVLRVLPENLARICANAAAASGCTRTPTAPPPPPSAPPPVANANRGKPWTPEQDTAALIAVQAGRELAEIALELGRTATGVRLHLLDLAARQLEMGMGLPNAAASVRVSPEELTAHAAALAAKRGAAKPPRAPEARAAGRTRRARAPELATVALELTPDQAEALAAVQAGGSILLTGPAGTGKSFTVGAIERWARGAGRALAGS